MGIHISFSLVLPICIGLTSTALLIYTTNIRLTLIMDYTLFEFTDHLPIFESSFLSLELPHHNNYCVLSVHYNNYHFCAL